MTELLRLLRGESAEVLKTLPAASVRCVVTSPPYYGLRDYGTDEWEGGESTCGHALSNGYRYTKRCGKCGAISVDRQVGVENTPDAYVARLVGIFREVRRVLTDDGTLWLNLGDSYAANRSYQVPSTKGGAKHAPAQAGQTANRVPDGLKSKDLIGIPWRVAFALQADGWYLRSDIIWEKPNAMPESVQDRPTKSHEYLFLLTKNARYYYDVDAVREPHQTANRQGERRSYKPGSASSMNDGEHQAMIGSFAGLPLNPAGRNRRTVWTIPTQPYSGAHFAVMPEKLVEPCVLAGSAPRDTILDPFCGSGTVGVEALRNGRFFVGIDLNPEYLELAERRILESTATGY